MKNQLLLVCLLVFLNLHLIGQTEVQAFIYTSETRDTVIDFPTTDNNEYEKILMLYSMRCKDGLVSTTAERNKGCGEWDYSCNTYITDSTRVDSIRRVHPSHIISNYDGDDYEYSNSPTYSYFQSTQQEVIYIGTLTENISAIYNGDQNIPWPMSAEGDERHQILYPASELLANGVNNNDITGIKLDVGGNAATFQHLRVRMKNSSQSTLDENNIDNAEFEEVFYLNTEFSPTDNFLRFHTPFDWDATSNVLIDISFTKTGATTTVLDGMDIDSTMMLSTSGDDLAVEFTGSETLELNNTIPSISNEVTISFWSKGNNSMPQNSTIFEGIDAEESRQLNVHLPWGNGQIYWDCGNDGANYDRINKPADPTEFKNQWNHWAFTKNATTGIMKIFLNGDEWHSGTGKTKPIDLQKLVVGGDAFNNNRYYGLVDEFQIWDVELDGATIKNWMHRNINNMHPNYPNLMGYYQFDTPGNASVFDQSPIGNNLTMNGLPQFRQWKNKELIKNFQPSTVVPNIEFVQGEYNTEINDVIVLDSLINSVNQIDEYIVVNNDLILDNTTYLYLAGTVPVYDENFNIVDIIDLDADGIILIDDLTYYSKSPAQFEIMSFVTPYGIGLDFGMEGKTWTFDVTDFGPILNGSKRIHMSRGGQWQEDIDIKFVFIPGTPTRDVVNINQVWPVTSESYTRIVSDERFESRTIDPLPEATQFKIKAAITGHGQEGEFVPRNHFVNVNGGGAELSWLLWTACADNPIFPQGGTWVYDRAGWCPGAPTDVQEAALDGVAAPGEPMEIDYDMVDASGTSNYIVNVQMVSYGDYNFENDVAITDILRPSRKVEHTRFNAMCGAPQIEIQNTGANTLTKVTAEYGMDGDYSYARTFDLQLAPMEKKTLFLAPMNMGNLLNEFGVFNVRLANPNNVTDEYAGNNQMESNIKVVPQYAEDVIIRLFTNGVPFETSYTVEDVHGNTIFSKNGDNLDGNTVYRDTIHNLNGCYRLQVDDSGEDGLSWWANSDGNGSIQIKDAFGVYTTLEPDFGKFIRYEFTAGSPLSTEAELDKHFLSVFPNPSEGIFNIELEHYFGDVEIQLSNQIGQILRTYELEDLFGQNMVTDLDLQHYSDGIYFLTIKEGSRSDVRRIVKLTQQ